MPRTRLAAALVILLVALSACAPGEPEFSANDQVAAEDRTEAAPEGEPAEEGGDTVDGPTLAFAAGLDLVYTEAPEEGPAGPLNVSLSCEGLGHNVVFEGVDGDQPAVECPGPGDFTGTTELEPDTYTYYCSIAGHRIGGMEGEITIG